MRMRKMRNDIETRKFIEDTLDNATDDAYCSENLKIAVKRFLRAEKAEDVTESQEAISEVAQIAAGIWKTYQKLLL